MTEKNDQNGNRSELSGLVEWSPFERLAVVSPEHARLSFGFLISQPERWFSSFSAQWLPLIHSLGIEFRVTEVLPLLNPPEGLKTTFVGQYREEQIGVSFESNTEALLGDLILNLQGQPKQIFLEYLALRLFGSITMGWGSLVGDDSAKFIGQSAEPTYHFLQNQISGVQIQFIINDRPGLVWVSLAKEATNEVDTLWKKQIKSTYTKGGNDKVKVELEVAELGIPIGELKSFLQTGAVVELEALITDLVIIRANSKIWGAGRLCVVGDRLGVELVNRQALEDSSYEGIDVVSVRYPVVEVDSALVLDSPQMGVILTTDLPASNKVNLVLKESIVGKATLCEYNANFAIVVI